MISATISLEVVTCCACGVTFALPQWMKNKLQNEGGTFYCPNGHSLSWDGKTKVDDLEKQLVRERAKSDQLAARVRDINTEKEATERRLSAAKGQLTKTKNRVGKGVCPCCNRTFADLQRHMETKHPTYANEEAPAKEAAERKDGE